jgi:hypothetical protein
MRARNLSLISIAVLLCLGACKQSGPEPEARREEAAKQTASFKLKVVFRGLIGFSQDSGKLWAFLINAQYDPARVGPDDLPPGVYHELGGDMTPRPANWLNKLSMTVPPHFAYISFTNARVTGCSTCDPAHNWRRPIFGADLHLNASQQGQNHINLDALASGATVIKARPELKMSLNDLSPLDRLDTSLMNPLQNASSSIDRRLAARAEIELGDGDEVSANLVPDRARKIARYTFNRPSETTGCRGEIENGQRIAEEVVFTRQQVTSPLTLSFGPQDAITIEALDPTKDVTVNILNQTRELLDTGGEVMVHPQAHRWFYRLTNSEGQSMVEKHFFACKRGDFGPPDCPQRQMFVVREGGR